MPLDLDREAWTNVNNTRQRAGSIADAEAW
jgi:hypothetical protein